MQSKAFQVANSLFEKLPVGECFLIPKSVEFAHHPRSIYSAFDDTVTVDTFISWLQTSGFIKRSGSKFIYSEDSFESMVVVYKNHSYVFRKLMSTRFYFVARETATIKSPSNATKQYLETIDSLIETWQRNTGLAA